VESNVVIVALAGIVAVTVLVVVGLAGIGEEDPAESPPPVGATTEGPGTGTQPTETSSGGDGEEAAPQRSGAKARLVLTAARGGCWMQVRAGGVGGRLLWEGTLEPGQTQRFVKNKRLWLELGAPANVNAKLNGERVRFPGRPAIVVVTADGVRTVSTSA
jgi:hypothetical protein